MHLYVAGFWCERQQEMDFFTGGSVIMDYGLFKMYLMVIFCQKWLFKVKNMFIIVLFQLFSSQDVTNSYKRSTIPRVNVSFPSWIAGNNRLSFADSVRRRIKHQTCSASARSGNQRSAGDL